MHPASSLYRSLALLLQQFFFAGWYHHFLPKRKRLCFRTLMLDVNNHPAARVESQGETIGENSMTTRILFGRLSITDTGSGFRTSGKAHAALG